MHWIFSIICFIFLIKSLIKGFYRLSEMRKRLQNDVCPLIAKISLIIHLIDLVAVMTWLVKIQDIVTNERTEKIMWFILAAIFVIAIILAVISYLQDKDNEWSKMLVQLDIGLVMTVIFITVLAIWIHKIFIDTCGSCSNMP